MSPSRARYDQRMLAMTTRLNLMDKRWDELRRDAAGDACRVGRAPTRAFTPVCAGYRETHRLAFQWLPSGG